MDKNVNGGRVLLVEDDTDLLRLFQTVLPSAGLSRRLQSCKALRIMSMR